MVKKQWITVQKTVSEKIEQDKQKLNHTDYFKNVCNRKKYTVEEEAMYYIPKTL